MKIKTSSIRTRLLITYVSIILVGFAALALVVGGQISSSARADFTQRLQNEISLIAQGIAPVVEDYLEGQIDDAQLQEAFSQYETRVNGTLTLYPMQEEYRPEPRESFRDMVEMETALRGQIVVVERANEQGESTFYTAAPFYHDEHEGGLIQLAVPADNLQSIVMERWIELGLIFALITGLALLAALWLARSIIQPLDTLRESALRLSQGDLSHRVAYAAQDEIGEVAQAFNEMAQQVQSMLEEQRAFASNTSHELRTPLTTVRLRTEALRHDPSLDEPTAKQYIAEIDDEMLRLGNLVQDLTLLSRFDAGRAELGQDQVDMLRFASSLQQQMASNASEKNIQISLALPDEPLPIKASINHLMVVFRNVLDNAIKYTPQGGKIIWTIQKAGQGVSSSIHDTGRGVDVAHLPHLFERFYRVDKARSRDIPGTGLGLALAKSIIEAYGGNIRIESDGADQGTTVHIFWPEEPHVKPNITQA